MAATLADRMAAAAQLTTAVLTATETEPAPIPREVAGWTARCAVDTTRPNRWTYAARSGARIIRLPNMTRDEVETIDPAAYWQKGL